ncbi:MAG: hypothetical protein JW833_12090 [Prolixibacteraceae bacterium]|nr:hypothetical protein [Prolixibacteraceae bacterium]
MTKPNKLNHITLVVIFLMVTVFNSNCQEYKSLVFTGVSSFDLFHSGFGFKINDNIDWNAKLGTSFNKDYGFWGTYIVGSGLSFYLDKTSEKYTRKNIAFNSNITFCKDEDFKYIWKYLFLDNSVSIDLLITKFLVCQPQVGIAVQLVKNITDKPYIFPADYKQLDNDIPFKFIFGTRIKILL